MKKQVMAVIIMFMMVWSLIPVCGAQSAYTIDRIRFTDQNGEELADFQAGQEICIETLITQQSVGEAGAQAAVAVFRADGALQDIFLDAVPAMEQGQNTVLQVSYSLPEDYAQMQVKAFVWKDLSSIQPLAETVEKKFEENQQIPIEFYLKAIPGSMETIDLGRGQVRIELARMYDDMEEKWVTPGEEGFTLQPVMDVASSEDIDLWNDLEQYCSGALEVMNDTQYRLVDVKPVQGHNKIVELSSEDIIIENLTGPTETGYQIEYYADKTTDRRVTVEVAAIEELVFYDNGRWTDPASVDQFYNFFEYYIEQAEELEFELRLLDPTGVGERYTTAFVTTYDTYVVDSADVQTYRITSKNRGSLYLDETNENYHFMLIKDGEKIAFADIQPGDVLSVSGSVQDRYLEYGRIFISSEKIEGVIESVNSEEQLVTIGGTTYSYTEEIDYRIREGNEGIWYLDCMGRVVHWSAAKAKPSDFLFVTNVRNSTDAQGGIDVEAVDMNGAWKTYRMAEKVRFSGASSYTDVSSVDEIPMEDLGCLQQTEDGVCLVNQLVYIRLNGDGQIEQYNAQPVVGGYPEDDVFTVKEISSGREYDSIDSSFGDVMINEDTIVILCEGEQTEGIDAENVVITDRSSLTGGDWSESSMWAYSLDQNNTATVLVAWNLIKGTGETERLPEFFTVKTAEKVFNDSKEIVWNLTGFEEGMEKSLVLSPETAYYDLRDGAFEKSDTFLVKGDVLFYSKTESGEVNEIRRVLKADNITSIMNEWANPYANAQYPDENGQLLPVYDGNELHPLYTDDTQGIGLVFGYVRERRGANLGLVKDDSIAESTYYSTEIETEIPVLNWFLSSADQVVLGDSFEAYADPIANDDFIEGDYVLGLVIGDGTMYNMVIVKATRY